MLFPIKPGEATRYQCDTCLREYEIQLEPKAAEMQTQKEMASATPEHCPFCGGSNFAEV